MLLFIIVFGTFILSCVLSSIEYGSENNITVPNYSFENSELFVSGDDGLLQQVDDWEEGGTWYGRFYWTDGVSDGDRAVWSSYDYQGVIPDNGYSQSLSTVFEVGQYRLNVMALGDNTSGLTSRLILGYDSGSGNYIEIGDSLQAITKESTYPDNHNYSSNWFDQEVVVEVKEGSPAIGKPIWIRMTSSTNADGVGGNSCWWDNVRLTVASPIE